MKQLPSKLRFFVVTVVVIVPSYLRDQVVWISFVHAFCFVSGSTSSLEFQVVVPGVVFRYYTSIALSAIFQRKKLSAGLVEQQDTTRYEIWKGNCRDASP